MPLWFIPLDFVRIKREDAYERFLSTVKYSLNTMYLSCMGHLLGATNCYQGPYLTREPHYFLYYKVYLDQLSESYRQFSTGGHGQESLAPHPASGPTWST